MKKIIRLAEIALEVPALQKACIIEIEKELKLLQMGESPIMMEAIKVGQEEGKLAAVKYLKNNYGGTLLECKKTLEAKFNEMGLEFKKYEY
jgi:hypothetical protein